ncbi:hypothetical protein HMPREF1022_00832 [Desulfovibrio sp. 6_1_46AFAA]|uniref:beta strand repeat-containing protein n=1 Tax=Desulfovibrio sp. 6_1_46AFAA TaxID=665942 RepID=UPI0002237068|nr:hypothetical protein [Desulfovibrio sp. 6_1_46AFAA]EGW52218.1 hypothetical protein HMPREF1022_00832 [Desulfovibrio sp. 6_1_46AFAA]
MAVEVPTWFEEKNYLNNKAVQLNATKFNDRTDWTADSALAAIEAAGMSAYEHFVAYGNAENISPNPMFNVAEYLAAKAAQLNSDPDEPKSDWTEADVLAAFNDAGLTAWDHYTQYGMYEGINPSNQFDTSGYFTAKLAQLQAAEPDKGWTEESMLAAFKEAGLNPLEHYAQYGKDEGLSVPPVPSDERVVTDFDPYTPSNPGETFTLTTGTDHITGTADDDVINGVASSLTADRTLNSEDVIDGAEGNDTLNVAMQGNFSGFTTGSMTNVEKVVLTNEGSIARGFSAKGVDGVKTWTLNDTGAAVNLADLSAAGVTVNVQGLKAGSTSIGFTADAVQGDADALTLGLNNVGTAKDGDTAAKHVAVTANGIENLAVKVTGDNYADLSAAASKTVTVSGSGNLDVNNVAGITGFDASALSGNVTADLSDAMGLATVKGGSGDDTITVAGLAANAVLEGGAGNDSLILQGVNGTLQPTMSGFENITADGGTLTLSGKNMSDFNSLTVKNGADVTLANMDASTFTVTASGTTAGSVSLNAATALTYNTVASKTDKTADSVSTTVAASKATSATVNVGEYTQVNGALSFGAAADVTVNVASGLGSDGKAEMTSFGGTLTANKAQSLTIDAEGLLKASIFNVGAASSVLVDAAQGSGTDVVNIQASKATDVSITAGSAMDITGSSFSSAQNVTLAANKGHLSGGVALGAVNQLTLSGADATSQVTLGALGSLTQEYGITVDASGLEGGLTLGNTGAGTGDVALNLADVTGAAKVGTVGGNNVTIHAAQLGTTVVGNITATGDVNIDAMGVLGGNATDAAFKAGVTTGKTITVNFDGNSDMTFGTLGGNTVNLDASGYLGAIVASNSSGVDAAIGAITADTVVIKGSEIGANTFSSMVTDTLTYTGGLGVDTVSLTGKGAGTTMNVSLDTGAGDDVVTIKAHANTTGIKVTGDMGGDTDTIAVIDGSSITSIDLSGLRGYSSSAITATAGGTLIGGAGDDTFTLHGAASAGATSTFTLTGGLGKDTYAHSAALGKTIMTVTEADFNVAEGDNFTGFSAVQLNADQVVTFLATIGITADPADITFADGANAKQAVYMGNSYLLTATAIDDTESAIQLLGVTADVTDHIA